MSFRRATATAGFAAAGLSFAYALALALPSLRMGGRSALYTAATERDLHIGASWLLFALGLTLTLAVVGLDEIRPGPNGWRRWGLAMGVLGAVLVAANGLYDAISVPALLRQWALDVEGRRAAISAFSGLPSEVDPRGMASLLMMGLFVAVASGGFARGSWVRRAGAAHAALSVAAFIAGALAGLLAAEAYSLLAGIAFGVSGPIWWALAGRDVMAAPDQDSAVASSAASPGPSAASSGGGGEA